jgi:hypothetical protein
MVPKGYFMIAALYKWHDVLDALRAGDEQAVTYLDDKISSLHPEKGTLLRRVYGLDGEMEPLESIAGTTPHGTVEKLHQLAIGQLALKIELDPYAR